MIAQYITARKEGIRDGREAAEKWFDRNMQDNKPAAFPSDMGVNIEKYGFIQKYNGKAKNIMNNYRWGWIETFESTMYDKYASFFDPDGKSESNGIKEYGIVNVSGDKAREIYDKCRDNNEKFQLYIRCSVCHKISKYAGYPAVPQVSSVLCLNCGAFGPAGYMYLERSLLDRMNGIAGKLNDNKH